MSTTGTAGYITTKSGRQQLPPALVVEKVTELWPELAREQANSTPHLLSLLRLGDHAVDNVEREQHDGCLVTRQHDLVGKVGDSAVGHLGARWAVDARSRVPRQPGATPMAEPVIPCAPDQQRGGGILLSGSVAQTCARITPIMRWLVTLLRTSRKRYVDPETRFARS